MSKARGPYRVDPLGYKKANEALDKMAENARELGLDYEPAQKPQRWAVFCQGCRKEWSVSYPHPGKSICVDCDDKLAQQEPVARSDAYDMIDRFLQNNLNSDADYAEYSKALDSIYTSPPAQQEPVAWMWKDGTITNDPDRADGTWTPLYTSPPAQRTWVGLTDEERREIGHPYFSSVNMSDVAYARAIEAKLKEKNT